MINIKKTKREYLGILSRESFKTILDIGCSKGYMSRRFAKNKTKVIGVDKKCQTITEKNFKFIKKDILDFKFEKYDLVIASLVLHRLKNSKAAHIVKKIQNSTFDGGFNLLICLSKKDCFAKSDYFYPTKDELVRMYSDWKIIRLTEDFSEIEKHAGQKEHRHNLILCWLRKGELDYLREKNKLIQNPDLRHERQGLKAQRCHP